MERVVTIGFEVAVPLSKDTIDSAKQSDSSSLSSTPIAEDEGRRQQKENKELSIIDEHSAASLANREEEVDSRISKDSSLGDRNTSYLDQNLSQSERPTDLLKNSLQRSHKDEETADEEKNAQISPSGSNSEGQKKKVVEDFEYGRILGEGSYAVVRLARDKKSGREFAVKILDKKQIIKEKKIKSVNMEKEILEKVSHRNIVKLFYTFQDPLNLYLVMEWCPNGELLRWIQWSGGLGVRETLFYFSELLAAVGTLHSLHFAHRDLKPENILMDREMHLKLTDFGTAKLVSPSDQ